MLSFGIEYDRALVIAVGQRRVGGWIGPALLGRDDDRPRELGEELAALLVRGALLVLDRRPFGVTAHAATALPQRATISAKSRCRRRSSVSSGWKAVTSTPSCCAAAIAARHASARTSTPCAGRLDPRRPDEHAGAAARRIAGKRQLRLEARHLAAEGVAAHVDVDQPQERWSASPSTAFARPGSCRRMSRTPARRPRAVADRLAQPVGVDQLGHGGRLPAGDHQTMQAQRGPGGGAPPPAPGRPRPARCRCSRNAPCSARTPTRDVRPDVIATSHASAAGRPRRASRHLDADHRLAEPGRHLGQDRRVVEVGGGLDDRRARAARDRRS